MFPFQSSSEKKKLLEAVAAMEISVESWEEEEGAISPDHLPQTSVKGKYSISWFPLSISSPRL
jgi:hypothetical protein